MAGLLAILMIMVDGRSREETQAGASTTDPTIVQYVSALVPGQRYILAGSYKKDYVSGCGTCPSFAVDFDGLTVFTATAQAPAEWGTFSTEVVATSTTAQVRLRGETNGTDIDWVIDNISLASASPLCLGDVSGNHSVDGVDLAALLGTWGTNGQGEFDCDIDNDGIVSGTDLTIVLVGWGACPN